MKPGQFPATPAYWSIAYIDGSTVRGRTIAEWIAAPADGVLTVLQVMRETYRLVNAPVRHYAVRLAFEDYYYLDADGLASATAGKFVPRGLPDGAVKRGAWTTREAMVAAYNAVLTDPTADEVVAVLRGL